MLKKILSVIMIVFISSSCFADDRKIHLLSDAEIENNLKLYIKPLVKAAKLNPDNITIHIVADPSLNAFVINGTDMFINSGLIIKFADDPNVLYGVMAHEIAHIYAGHLTRMRSDYENMSKVALGGAVLGVASMFAGAPDAGAFVAMGSAQAAERGMLKYSREYETEADKIAVNLLYKTNNNGQGLIKFFQYMSQRDRSIMPDPYAITHPLSNQRMASIKNSISEKLGKFGDNITPLIKINFKRMATKLEAFLASPSDVISKYKDDKYGLAIGYFRSGQLKKATNLLEQVIEKEPNNPYLWELKGQFYFENGIFNKSTEYYQKALSFVPKDNLIKVELASSQINSAQRNKNSQAINAAIKSLKQVIAAQPSNLMAYFMLSRAYGIAEDQPRAISALADFYFYQGEYEKSKILANKVIKMTKANSPEYIRANDILFTTKNSDQGK